MLRPCPTNSLQRLRNCSCGPYAGFSHGWTTRGWPIFESRGTLSGRQRLRFCPFGLLEHEDWHLEVSSLLAYVPGTRFGMSLQASAHWHTGGALKTCSASALCAASRSARSAPTVEPGKCVDAILRDRFGQTNTHDAESQSKVQTCPHHLPRVEPCCSQRVQSRRPGLQSLQTSCLPRLLMLPSRRIPKALTCAWEVL